MVCVWGVDAKTTRHYRRCYTYQCGSLKCKPPIFRKFTEPDSPLVGSRFLVRGGGKEVWRLPGDCGGVEL